MRTTRSVSKAEIREALRELNLGVERVVRALTVLQRAGLDLPFINGQKILMEEIRSEANHQIPGLMTRGERKDCGSSAKEMLLIRGCGAVTSKK